jgi:hypothetical protein
MLRCGIGLAMATTMVGCSLLVSTSGLATDDAHDAGAGSSDATPADTSRP